MLSLTLALALTGSGAGYTLFRASSPPPRSTPAAVPRLFASQAPFIGVACRWANSIRCGRIGIAVWLRHPADSVTATLNGKQVLLRDETVRGGQVVTYIGYVHISPRALRLPTTWQGAPMRRLVLDVVARHGATLQRETIWVLLHPGWG